MTILRNIAAVVIGIVLGSALNMFLVTMGSKMVPPPPGLNMADPQSLSTLGHLLEPKHFVFPFLAHALGTFFGAFAAHVAGTGRRSLLSYIVAGMFLIGGIMAAFMIPAPAWFLAADLVLAYIPMAWLATRLGYRVRGPVSSV